jgi:hypothetical protein
MLERTKGEIKLEYRRKCASKQQALTNLTWQRGREVGTQKESK